MSDVAHKIIWTKPLRGSFASRRLSVVFLAVTTGCGWISGLDDLSVDASTEDALDGAVDGSSDVSDVGAPFCSYSVSIATPFCSGCSGGCCVTNDAANTCASPICAALLTCVASADCAAGTICCLQNVTLPNSIMECPVELTVSEATSDKTTSGCTEAATCVGSMNLHMCATDADCAGAHCRKATLSNNTSFTFGVCT